MSDRPDSFMPLWIGDYLADTMRLTRDQHGGYLLLIMDYWRQGEALPDDDDALAAITKASPVEWKKLRPVLARFFEVADGKWTHGRIEQELKSAQEQYTAKVERAKAGAAKRWGKHMPDGCSSNPQASSEQSSSNANHNHTPTEKNPSGSSSDRRAKGSARAPKGAAQPSPAASSEGPNDTRWEQGFPKWLKVRQTFGDTLWLSTFGCCRPNGSETSIIAPSKFWAEKLDTQFSDKLERVFGEPVTFKFQEEAKP